jgi:predicted dehydrogenase
MSRLRPPIEATFFPPLVTDPAVRSRELEYKAAHRGKHLLATHGIHIFDLLRFLVGDYQVHSAVLSHNGIDYSWHALGRVETGGALSIEVTASVHAEWSEGIDIYGDLGHLRLRCPFVFTRQASSIRIFDEASQMRSEPVFGKTDPYERQIEGFATAILCGHRPSRLQRMASKRSESSTRSARQQPESIRHNEPVRYWGVRALLSS